MEEVKLQLLKKALEEKKAENIIIYDVSKTSPICSYIIVCTMLNGRHGKALADACVEIQEKLGQTVRHIEGKEIDKWILVDLNDIIVHLFDESERSKINLDGFITSVNKYV